jgi:hypothetical protein
MEDNRTTDWSDDGNHTGYTDEEIARAEDEAERLFDAEPSVDLSGINPDCNESQQFRGDEFTVTEDELNDIPENHHKSMPGLRLTGPKSAAQPATTLPEFFRPGRRSAV